SLPWCECGLGVISPESKFWSARATRGLSLLFLRLAGMGGPHQFSPLAPRPALASSWTISKRQHLLWTLQLSYRLSFCKYICSRLIFYPYRRFVASFVERSVENGWIMTVGLRTPGCR